MRAVRWSGIEYADYDLCARRRGGIYDVVRGVDGWVVYTPGHGRGRLRWLFDGARWSMDIPKSTATRDEARVFAESMIREAEGRVR